MATSRSIPAFMATSSPCAAKMIRTLGLLAVLGICLSKTAEAHEHHTDNVPEGEAISAEPLVGQPLKAHLKDHGFILNCNRTQYYGFTSAFRF